MKKLSAILILFCTAHIMCAQPCITNTNSLFFNGTSSYVSLASQTGLNITDSITVEAWIFSTQWAATSAQNTIVCKHGWSAGEAGYVLRVGGSGQLSFNLGGFANGLPTSWIDNVSATGSLTLNTWYHVAGTFDGTSSKIYINGVLAGTVPFVGTIVPSPTYPLTIGKLSDPAQAAGRYFSGYMDEIRIWHRALSATEIQSQMNDHINPLTATGLVSYWRMNNGSGTTVTDLTGNNNGFTNNTSWSTTVPFNNSPPPTPTIAFNGVMLASNSPVNNQWYLNGVLIPGATGITYTPLQNGVYTCVVTASNGCTATSNAYTITTVGITETLNNISVSLYPNPANNVLTIDAGSLDKADFTLSNAIGDIVMRKQMMESKNQIDVKNLAHGLYFLKIHSDRGNLTTKFIKQ